jgi:hypothetical protein
MQEVQIRIEQYLEQHYPEYYGEINTMDEVHIINNT